MVAIPIFFVGYVNIHSDVIGVPHFLPTSEEIERYWDTFSWAIFGMLALDITLKYRNAGIGPRAFLKKYWLEIAMLTLIPVFAAFKVAKVSVKLIKALKMTKSGFKVAHGANKASKSSGASE
jgi:hypothetical protein